MYANMPARISDRWLSAKRSEIGMTAKSLHDGSPNPRIAELEAEIADAEATQAARHKFEAWVKATLDLRPNDYDVKVDGVVVKPGKAFVRKDRTTGRLVAITQEQAWEQYQAATV